MSNVHTCIPNSAILESLQNLGVKTASAVHELHIGLPTEFASEAELVRYKHVASFRRAVYIIEDEKTTLPTSLLISYENETYRIFINESEQRCHLCGISSHNAVNCPTIDTTNKEFIPEKSSAEPTNGQKSTTPNSPSQPQKEDNLPFEERINHARIEAASRNNTKQLPGVKDNQPPPAANSYQIEQMETSFSKPKRQHTASSTSLTQTRKKKTKANSITSTDDDDPNTDESTNINDILKPAQTTFEDTNKTPPLTFTDAVEFIKQCAKPKKAHKIIPEYTNDIAGTIDLLNQVYELIDNRNIRNRLTRIKKALSKSYSP